MLIQLTQFFVVVRKYKIHVFDEAFLFSATIAKITENVTCSSFDKSHCKENKLFHHNHAPSCGNPGQNRGYSLHMGFMNLATRTISVSYYGRLIIPFVQ